MPLVPMRQMLDEAGKKQYGVGAYNVNNMEQLQGIMKAARETGSPVIIQASRGALRYTNFVYLKHLMLAAVEDNPGLKIALHLDHGDKLDTVKKAIDLGFTSVMIDGSLQEDGKTPRTFDDNARVTKEVVDYAHQYGVTVEGELGTLGGIEEHIAASTVLLTDPGEAKTFIEFTGVDALAVAIGTSHGAYKFKAAPKLALEIVDEIHKLCPQTALVMHGSSSVPQELTDQINKYGGKMPGAKGTPIESIQAGIKLGVRKINVDTDSRMAMTGAIRKVFTEQPDKFDPRDYLGPAREAIAVLLKSKMADFGTAGHNDDYEPKTLDDMKKLYGK
jgi:fructose-bisphosphate aldolase class II